MTDPAPAVPVPAVPVEALKPWFRRLFPNGLSPYLISRVRTVVPIAVGTAITWGEHQLAHRYHVAISIDTPTAAIVATGFVSSLYYEALRRLEKWKPSLGWLLGYPSQPTY